MESYQPLLRRHRALFLLGTLLLLQWFCWRWMPGSAANWELKGDDTLELAPTKLEGVTYDPVTKQFQTTKEPAWLYWESTPIAGMLYLKLTVTTEGINDTAHWILQYRTRHAPYFEDTSVQARSLKPLVKLEGTTTELTWQLPVAAEAFRLCIPKAARWTIQQLHLAGLPPDEVNWHTWRQAIIVLCFALNLSLFICWLAQNVEPLLRLASQPAFISVIILALHGTLMIWLLPPFQGPDENRHWKAAVQLFRGDGQPGSVLYRLPIILDAESPRWQAETPFHAANLHALATIPRGLAENKGVGYVKHWGYPIVGLVSFLFQPVDTVTEALIFYYSCRVMTLLILLGLVVAAWRLGLGSWTLIAFLSFPIVMQQCVIVSTDTVHNLGTLLAVLLFRRHQQVQSKASLLALLLVCCLVVAAKPPIYLAILLLPAWFLPWSLLRRPTIWMPSLLAVLLIAGAGIFYLWHIVDSEGMGLGAQARKQLEYVLTGPGIAQFITASMEYPSRFMRPICWWEPLGWLDTNLTDLHTTLLWISLYAALALDLIRWITWLRSAGLASLWNLIDPIAVCLVNYLFVWWSLALVMYLTITDYQSASIVGMQVRYMVPVALLFLTLPAARLPGTDQSTRKPLLWLVVTMLILAIARAVCLAGDLQHRYWG